MPSEKIPNFSNGIYYHSCTEHTAGKLILAASDDLAIRQGSIKSEGGNLTLSKP